MSAKVRRRRRRDPAIDGEMEARNTGETVGEKDISAPPAIVEGDSLRLARVRVSGGLTKNMGNFNSVRVNVSVELPTEPDDASLEAAYARASRLVQDYIDRELDLAERAAAGE